MEPARLPSGAQAMNDMRGRSVKRSEDNGYLERHGG
jgi:hypothetical protein